MSHSHSHGSCSGDHHHHEHHAQPCSGHHSHAHGPVTAVTSRGITFTDVASTFNPHRLMEAYHSDPFIHSLLLFFFIRSLLLGGGILKSIVGGDMHYTLLPTIFGMFGSVPLLALCFAVLTKLHPIHSAVNSYKAQRLPLVAQFVASVTAAFTGLFQVFEHLPELSHSHNTEYSLQLDIRILHPFFLCWVVFMIASHLVLCLEPAGASPFIRNAVAVWKSLLSLDCILLFQYLQPVLPLRIPDMYVHLLTAIFGAICVFRNWPVITEYLIILAHGVPASMLQALNNLTPHERPHVWSADGHSPVVIATLTFPQVNAQEQILSNLPQDSKLLIN